MSDPGTGDGEPFLVEAANIDVLVLGTAPSQSFAMLDAVMTQALGLAMINEVSAQQNASAARNAAILMACTAILSIPIADVAASDPKVSSRAAVEPQVATADQTPAHGVTGADRPATAASAQGSVAESPSNSTTADARVVDAVNLIQGAVLAPQVVLTSGAGKAYQAVAQSMAVAIQDATDALRGTSILAATAASVSVVKFLTHGDPKYLLGVAAARDMMINATDEFAKVSANATTIVKAFPAG
jgi:hypothetical protein